MQCLKSYITKLFKSISSILQIHAEMKNIFICLEIHKNALLTLPATKEAWLAPDRRTDNSAKLSSRTSFLAFLTGVTPRLES